MAASQEAQPSRQGRSFCPSAYHETPPGALCPALGPAIIKKRLCTGLSRSRGGHKDVQRD